MAQIVGRFAHECREWDGMLIDETCPEFEVCRCYDSPASIEGGQPCPNCSADMVDRACKRRCNHCGYFEDCSNLL